MDSIGHEKTRAILPALLENATTNDHSESGEAHIRHIDEARSVARSREVLVANAVLGPCLEQARRDGCAPVIPQPAGAEFYRYQLAEAFGASVVGPGASRIRSKAIIDYRTYVAMSRSDILQATDDTLCLMLPGCKFDDPGILLEGQKRHLAGIQCMQKTLEKDEYDVDSTIASAIELVFIDIYKPISVGTKDLYSGVVALARKCLSQLRYSQTPVTVFLLLQIRQMMVLRSLASETALPIKAVTWQHLCRASTLPKVTETLMQLAIHVPDLVAAAHNPETSDSTDASASARLAYYVLTLQRRLEKWDVTYCSKLDAADRRQDPVGPRRVSFLDEHKETPLEGDQYHHLPFLTSQCKAYCHICLLALHESLANLFMARNEQISRLLYATQATRNADTLCNLAEHFMKQEATGSLSKALSACAPLYFARQWYTTSENDRGLTRVADLESQVQKEVSFFSWESLLPVSFPAMYMLG